MIYTRRVWTHAEECTMRAMHHAGFSLLTIASALGRDKSTVHRRARAAGLGTDDQRKRWSAADVAALCARYPHERTEDIARDLGCTVRKAYCKAAQMGLKKSPEYLASPQACRLRRGDNVGLAYRFQKGQTPANKGVRRPGWATGRMRETQFKKGEMSGRARELLKPIGAERINRDGYLERKINNDLPMQRRWRAVHLIVWETANGPLPPSHAVVFKNGNKGDIRLDNLELITRQALMARNTVHNYPKPIAQCVQLRGAIQRQINRRAQPRDPT